MSQFDDETLLQPDGDGTWSGRVHAGWNIGGNPNGGYLAAIAVAAARRAVPAHPDPLSVTLHYLRPGLGDQPCSVDVRVLQDPNEFSLGLHLYGAPNIAFMGKLIDAGVPLRLYRSSPGGQMHQKSLLVDDRWVVVGATNWTRQSFRVNTESSYLVDSQRQATRLAQRFTEDWESHSVAPDAQRLQQRRAYSAMLRLLSEYL